jgi:hypothetical protein
MSNAALAMPAEVAEHKAAQEQHRVIGDMLARSATDSAFRSLMLSDAHAAFAQSGLDVPAAMDVVFIENKYDLTIVLPDSIDELAELNETELMQFNGGSAPVAGAEAGAAAGSTTSPVSASVGAVVGAAITLAAWYIIAHY